MLDLLARSETWISLATLSDGSFRTTHVTPASKRAFLAVCTLQEKKERRANCRITRLSAKENRCESLSVFCC